ncbi:MULTISPECIES: LysR family transcriptional regulator [Burkholderia]|uniref:LysR family transcriptional regulator n=1 Tax=Burkholderia TaxID=32008 RepID=UPI0006270697|nr:MULTISPECIES: LysR family transcriptional regulator [Burkholderia]KKJ03134.1 LysR family transcriptional regulator [Burkholderia gladioli]MBU9274194.1 LysR family transcriptional regulator [Burkholderia gladioli]MBU9643098.1 LysR family transcriptional regulator [Burkholderia gladioli]MBU9682566.1 LysR family transcriptional regulator [Burkholderia gladioli]MDN7493639.1 LysR family transcriptional regulator [Burkholderia gladioli]
MDRLDAIRLFVRLVERGSFSAVGREEGIGQPAVSKQIAALERHLGAQLLLRTSRRIAVTDAGQAFYESARQLVEDFDAVESSVGERQQSPRGLVRLNTAPGHGRLWITPRLPEFFARHPEVSVELSVSERNVDLVGQGIDLAIRHGKLVDSSLIARRLGETALVLAASRDYLAAHGTPARLDDLDAHRCIVFSRDREPYPWALRVGREALSYRPRGSLLTGDAEHVRAAVVNGLGISQAPLWLLEDEIRAGRVQVLLPRLQPEPLPIHLVHAAGRRVPMRVRVLIDFLVEIFASDERARR